MTMQLTLTLTLWNEIPLSVPPALITHNKAETRTEKLERPPELFWWMQQSMTGNWKEDERRGWMQFRTDRKREDRMREREWGTQKAWRMENWMAERADSCDWGSWCSSPSSAFSFLQWHRWHANMHSALRMVHWHHCQNKNKTKLSLFLLIWETEIDVLSSSPAYTMFCLSVFIGALWHCWVIIEWILLKWKVKLAWAGNGEGEGTAHLTSSISLMSLQGHV